VDHHPDMKLEDVARDMRAAFNEHVDPKSALIPWELANPDRKEAWMVCARAAFKAIFGTEYPQ
jgi:hypothetical protein